MEKKNQVLMTVLGVFALVIVTVGVTYAFFTYTRTGTTESVIKTSTGEISFVYTNDDQGVLVENAQPMTVEQGKAISDTYDFSIAAMMTTNATINYTITAVNTTGANKNGKTAFENGQIRAYLTEANGINETPLWTTDTDNTKLMSDIIPVNQTEGPLYNGTLTTTASNASQSKQFKLRIWIDEAWKATTDTSNTDVNASDNGTGTIQEGNDYTVSENGTKVTASATELIYSLKVKVTANAVSTQ